MSTWQKCTLVVLCTAFSVCGFGQRPINVKGFVRDSITNNPLANASVVFVSLGNKALAKKMTSGDGLFSLESDTGNYEIHISHVNYRTAIRTIELKNDTTLKNLFLHPASTQLTTVTIAAQKKAIEQDGEKITLNLENDPIAKTETALDILRRTPFVSVDGNDQVRLNGQSSFKIFLNGRETSLFANNTTEALRGLPGHLILKVEVYPSPSSKFDGEGIGGIINIVTKKKLEGYNGSLTAFYNTNNYYSTSIRFSAKFNKLSIIGYYSYTYNPLRFDVFNQTTAKGQAFITQRTLNGTRNTNLVTPVGNGELVWEPDSSNLISVYNTLSGGRSHADVEQQLTLNLRDSMFPSSSLLLTATDLDFPVVEVGLDYTRKFRRNKDQELSLRLNRQDEDNSSLSFSELVNPSLSRFVRNSSVAENRQYTFQLDYVQPLGNTQKMEVGAKTIHRKAFSDFMSMGKYSAVEDYKVNNNNTDYFDYSLNVLGAYSVYHVSTKGLNFILGARVEHTQIDGNFRTAAAKVVQNYTSFLPNMQVSKRIGSSYTVLLSYNKRLQRPFIWNLNPFINNTDSFNLSFGNPALNPQNTHQYTLQTRYVKGATFAGVGFTTSYTNDMIIQYTALNTSTGVTSTTSDNVGRERQLGVLLNLSTKPSKKWNLSLNANIYHISVQNKLNKQQVNKAIGTNGNVSTNYTVNPKFTVLAYSGFSGYPSGYQSKQSINAWYGTGATYKLFSNKLTASLRLANFFTPYNTFKTTTEDDQLRIVNHNKLKTWRSAALMLTWSFGKLKGDLSKKKGVDNDDLLKND